MKKKKVFRKAMSVLLSLTILVGTVSICLPFLKLDAGAVSIDSQEGETITQERVVDDYATDYANYKNYYLNGAGEPTDIVIPGLHAKQDYVVQGMAYYPQKDWMLVTAYHNDGTYSSKVFCLDAKTGEFVAMLSFKNVNSESLNMDHGGGIAISEHNLYYSCGDKDRKIAYVPLSDLDGITKGEHKVIQLRDEIEFYEVGSVTSDNKTAYTAYVCYDQGYLWMGNFYDLGAKLIGITIAAADYNVPANSQYNSMVFGYKLSGSTSEEEWNNLKNGNSDSRSNPTHTIALNNNIKDVQYAVVDSGKLYLSCSYGSGAGNSINFGFGETSKLIVSDIDLSAIPTKELTISTSSDNSQTKTVKAFVIEEYETYEMMPMSEGLCVINDLIFCTFEGASNKYMKESSGATSIGNCEKPVDVIWKIDPYELQNMVKTVDNNALHYEPVTRLSEIVDGEDYIIVYESSKKDPVTQMPILYAIDSLGGYQHYNLSKRDQNNKAGYTGAIGHVITEYSVEGGKLYLRNAEKDDVRNIRWELTSLGSGAYSIKNNEYAYSSYPYFYCDATSIAMATKNARGTSMVLAENGNGGFYISGGGYYLWCNDGTTASYNTSYNNYYANNNTIPMYSGVTEQPGTFHTDGLNATGSNVLGGQVTKIDHRVFYIYKRVVDKTATTYESRVYTNMNAELQSDGTYTIDLETYAISPNQYQYVGERPTDFIIVMDTSESVNDGSDGTGIQQNSGDITLSKLASEQITSDDNGTGIYGYAFTKEALYYKHSDGNYYRMYVAINTQPKTGGLWGIGATYHQKIWTYYVADDGLYYVLPGVTNAGISTIQTWTRAQFITNVDAGTNYSAEAQSTRNGDRQNCKIYNGTYYKFLTANDKGYQTPMYTIKEKAKDIVQFAASGSDNRIAITTYGGTASYLGKEGWSSSGFANAFWDADSSAENLKTQIDNITSRGQQSDNSGMELQFAQNIVANSDFTYDADGERNLAIIFMSDGVPGAYDGANITTAANNVIEKANTLKNKNGAFIYSIIFGADNEGWDKNTYMEAVSSKYPAATRLDALGGGNIDGVDYVINMADTSMTNFLNFTSIAGREINKNNAVGLSNLSTSSVIFEELNKAFKPIADKNGNLLDGIEITSTLVEGNFDAVERFTFNGQEIIASTAGVTTSVSGTNTRAISVTGYDYAKEYVSQSKTGRMLRIRITGVLADENADITNTSINNTSTTAIYKTKTDTSSKVFKSFPTEYFSIPTYTYVLDYDMPMLDKYINGTLCSVDAGLNKQSTYKTSRETENVALNFVDENQNMTYELVSSEYTEKENRSYCLIKRDDGTYDWFRINIVPASNVLFEEGRFTNSSVGELGRSDWKTETDGTPISTGQSLSGDDDRYGYDEAYANNGVGYSNGTVLKTTINSTKKRSETMKFSYTGTGFDLMAACGQNTGIQLVTVKNAKAEIERVYMVDTYYDGALLKQVPIINHKNAGKYGNYTVEVTAAYLSTAHGVTGGRLGMFNKPYTAQDFLKDMGIPSSKVEYVWFDDNSILNGGTGPVASANRAGTTPTNVELYCYIDSIRVYNPLGDDSSFYINSEKGATYYNIVSELATVEEDDVITSKPGLFAYVVGQLKPDADGNAPALSFSNYQSVGPQDEIYLQTATGAADSHAVAFNVQLPNSDSRVMISLRAVDGATKAKVASGKNSIQFEINTATEQYFDITPYLDINASTGIANVIITNNGTGLLSVNNLKLVSATALAVTSEDLNVMAKSFSLTPTLVDPNSYDYDGIGDEIIQQPDVDDPVVDDPVVDDPVVDDPADDNTGAEDDIFTRIVGFFKNFFESIFAYFKEILVI